ncbi:MULTISPECIES: Cd(II)/Pb(II)-responsive transcriptional regulator [Marinomonas]|uniref:Cd(II)/Pb(II)-responsive transcriptional regulator n=1 Tax=Marinomonas fungiae TaxID=1137284 RepID=A0A0K6IUC7_9GAMM|nr:MULTISPECIES: Cd(II)/Pb(II)-responsive transcriptional regulator [Marinomonas]CUB06716.1 Cd(II)/Pb(II)-responsive transcriptional regulator [Marinomonas fungiae]
MKIGELAKLTDTETVTIRFYERKGLMPPPERTTSNYRIYSDQHRERLLFIRHCRGIGINLDEIGQLLQCRDHPIDSCHHVNEMIDGHIVQTQRQIKELKQLEKQLRQLRTQCNQVVNPEGQAANCGILQFLENCQPEGVCSGHQHPQASD